MIADIVATASLSSLAGFKRDRAKVAASELASKAYFSGESSGYRIARVIGRSKILRIILEARQAPDSRDDDTEASPQEVGMLKARMEDVISDIVGKHSMVKMADLKRLLFRCASAIISLQKVRLLLFCHNGSVR